MSDKVKYPKAFGQHKDKIQKIETIKQPQDCVKPIVDIDRKSIETVETHEETAVVALKKKLKLLLTDTTGETYLIDGDQTEKLDISKAPFDMKTLKNKIYPASTLDALGGMALEYQMDKILKILVEKMQQEQKQEGIDYTGKIWEFYREKVTDDLLGLTITTALVHSQMIADLKVVDGACGINFLTPMRVQEKVRRCLEVDHLRALMTDKIGDSCTDSELLLIKMIEWCPQTYEADSSDKPFAEDTNHLVYCQEKFDGDDIMNKWDNEHARLHWQGIKYPFSVRKYMEHSEDQMILMFLKLKDQIPEIGPGEVVAKLLMMGQPVLDSYCGSCLYMTFQKLFYGFCAVERTKFNELYKDRGTEFDFLQEKEELDEMILRQFAEKHLLLGKQDTYVIHLLSVTLQSVC